MTSRSPPVPEIKTNTNTNQKILINETKLVDQNRVDEAEEENHNRNLYVVTEQEEGKVLPSSFEMLGEGRRLMDNFNSRYKPDEMVVAVMLGHNIKHLCQELLHYGADAVICADHQELRYPRNYLYTKIISQIATDKSIDAQISSSSLIFNKPRYMFFSADDTGRHLSSTVMAELESGLASDINKLVINDLEIRHEHKTKGKSINYKKTLEMYRPDFSGFLWTTILCLDNLNPENKKEFYPQACSIIPGVFPQIERDTNRNGKIIHYTPTILQKDLKVKIISRREIKDKVDFNNKKAIVSFGRGIKDSPEQNIKLIENFAKEVEAEIGISLPISKKPYTINENLSSIYMIPDRVIGTSGRKVSPLVYFAIGISGAVQHVAGMKEAEFVISINPDTKAPIVDESDVFIKGKIEEVLPLLTMELKKYKEKMKMPQEIK
jgi:electron transfer flavoprotein alpha subunit